MISGVMKPFPAGFPSPSSFCTALPVCAGAGAAAAIPARPKPGKSAARRAAKFLLVLRVNNISNPPLSPGDFEIVCSLRQRKAENVASRGDGHVLFSVHCIAHRRSMQALPGIKVPERLARLRVHGFKGLRIIAEKEKAAGSRHYST